MRRLYRVGAAQREQAAHAVADTLERKPEVVFAHLHGSFLTSEAFHDVDVAVHLAPRVPRRLPRALDLAEWLARETGLPVDVRLLNDATLAFRYHVFRTGRLLLSRDDELLADCMERTMREYLDIAPLLRRATVEAFGA